jgi:hypothetical protein
MNDHDLLARRLNDLAERIRSDDDALPAIERRRHRRHMRRRATAAVVACIVAIGGLSLAAVAVVNGSDGTTGASRVWSPASVPTLWPELWTQPTAAGTIADVQRRADVGDPSVQWRTDPRAVAERFTNNVLGWGGWNSTVARVEASPARWGQVRFRVSCGRGCTSGDPATTLFLDQPQRRGSGGIWSIVAVVDPTVDVAVEGSRVLPGGWALATAGASTVRVRISVGRGFGGRSGLELYNGCEIVQSSSPPIYRRRASWDHVVPWFATTPIDCGGTTAAGYVFGFVKSAEMGVDTQGPLDQPNVLLYHVTAIPVVVGEPETTGPDETP